MTDWPSVWLRPTQPAAERKLSRARLVECAMAALDAEGAEQMSMRRLAAGLDVTVGALYWHVASRDELLELALDEALAAAVPGQPSGQWRTDLSAFAERYRDTLLARPWLIPLLGRLPNIGPNALALADRGLALIVQAGLGEPAHVLAAVHDLVVGAVVAQQSWRNVTARHVAPNHDDRGEQADAASWSEHLATATSRYPNLAANMRVGTDIDAECATRFRFALDCLLTGLASPRTEVAR